MVVETCKKIPITTPRIYSWLELKNGIAFESMLPSGAIRAKNKSVNNVVCFLLPPSIRKVVRMKATGIL